MPDFSAILVHIRDLRAELARINSRVSALRSMEFPSEPGTAVSGRLHEAIAEYYNLAELRMLAAALGLNHEELDGEGLGDTALELVLWMRRHGRLEALLTALAAQRPHVNWSGYR
jgi:hypothetical protein